MPGHRGANGSSSAARHADDGACTDQYHCARPDKYLGTQHAGTDRHRGGHSHPERIAHLHPNQYLDSYARANQHVDADTNQHRGPEYGDRHAHQDA